MDAVLQDLPFLHPVMVHFPIAFMTAALLAVVGWAITGGRLWRLFILSMLTLGFLGAVGAYLSGQVVTAQAVAATADAELAALHTSAGAYSLALIGGALIITVAFNFYLERRTTLRRHPPDPPVVRAVIGLLVLAAWMATALAGYSGHLLAV